MNKKIITSLCMVGGILALGFAPEALADSKTIGGVASAMTASIAQIGRLIYGAAYVAGLGFSVGAIMKFKQHKDNPQQIPIGTPIALLFVGAGLLFLPSVLQTAGGSLFGTGSEAGAKVKISAI